MKNIKSMSISTIAVIIAITIITLYGELSSTFKDFLKNITGHHWTSKSIISIIIFFGLYFFLVKSDDDLDVFKEACIVSIITILASLIIFGFYLWHFLFG